MIKRLLLIAAMTAALAACGTSGTTGAPGNSLARSTRPRRRWRRLGGAEREHHPVA
jgi:hypothetical protein